jgi:hypothetical protein
LRLDAKLCGPTANKLLLLLLGPSKMVIAMDGPGVPSGVPSSAFHPGRPFLMGTGTRTLQKNEIVVSEPKMDAAYPTSTRAARRGNEYVSPEHPLTPSLTQGKVMLT